MTGASSSESSSPTSPNDRSSLPTTSTTTTASPTTRSKTQQAAMAMSRRDDREESAATTAAPPRSNPVPASSTHPPDDSTETTKPHRKRAYSIDVEEANQPRIQDLRLYTPNTATSNTSEGPRELICLCTKAPKVPRPRNAFILYRQHYQGQVAARHPGLANPEISKLIGEQWREQPEEIKNNWKRLAEEEKIRHQRQYPDYRYQPRRGGKTASSRPLPATGEDPGHCPKCGGRYIATPRTPSTPFSAATPDIARPAPNMPPYVTPNPRVIETDHLRRGSASSTMSLDHDRRFTQPHLHNIEEDYSMMSPMAAPMDPKRRRFNGPNIFVPGSPPMGYISADPRDPRFQRQSVAGPPMSAAGYGPGPLPRPGVQYHQPNYANHPHMQPPPRPPMQYQPVQTPSRPSNAFDESLRLPPLQTQIPNSPAMSSETGSARGVSAAQSAHGTGLGIVNGANVPTRQPQPQPQPQQVPPRWSFLLKLEILRSISPPLKPPGPGGPIFETRGPLIAIEGAAPSILKEVASVVEKALSVSGEYAVKTWTDDTQTQPSGGDTEGKNNNSGNESQQLAEKSPPKRSMLLSPLATYVARMLKWHKTSEELIKYMTSYAPSISGTDTEMGEGDKPAEDMSSKPNLRLPVAVISDGYSLTVSDKYASSLHVNDAYRADDHWQWVATLWRGIIGADLTIYVKKTSEPAEIQGNNCVEFVNSAVMVLRMAEGKGVDEKLERRLGFEILEWVRSGSFKAGFATRS
ncbi:uncharacterized protein F4807DRAFT_408520 [Annulohypoxylon truncatum]|uniref:uncharacterized protein n=1 Tax=Annulohypoxylon truncatum TaxID=327061 RepID=UPI0020085E90|nr:uncharacterized protein F4807DRAFT_408520 [Annulohypoxylon truncatum]KAI1213632.1 hypothetical protein F4807DRAFT_408520 [Annulohypoxylon truncatum]